MRTLLVNPEKLVAPPFGLLYIGSVLKDSGHEVSLLEVPFAAGAKERFDTVKAEIGIFRPEVIGITCMSMQAGIVKDLIANIREYAVGARILVGGVHPTLDSHEALSWGADIAVRGEAEDTVLEIADHFDKGKKIEEIRGISYRDAVGIADNPDRELMKDLNRLPPLSYDLLARSRLRMRSYNIRGLWLRCGWVMTARGCPGKCIFCASKTMHGRVVREFSIERILDEIERLRTKYDIEGLWVLDDTFSLKERRVLDFCEGLNRRGINITWGCQARVDTFTGKMAKAMKESGCAQVDFGVESGSQKVLDYIKKEIKCEDTKRAFALARQAGLRAGATVMVGVPNETKDDIQMTMDFLDEIKPDFVGPFFITPYPGTELYDMAKKNEWVDSSGDINWQSTEEPVMKTAMPSSEIKKAYERLLAYNRSTFLDYLRQPRFVLDLLWVFARRPKYIPKAAFYALGSRRRDFMNLFLYIFRKEMLKSR